MRYVVRLVALVGMGLVFIPSAWAQAGKIAGRVTDASTGEPLPGVNVVVVGSTQGSTTDVDGYYNILNVPPGTYRLRASFIGFTPQVVEDVRVNIDLTTTINFALQEEVIQGEEVVVTAQRPVVQPDLSASMASVTAEKIEQLPVSSVTAVVGLQAGIQGLSVRGSGADELAFNLNGLTLRDERDNTPYTSISLASVQEVQVQTGGFNAEYGNVRSGVINVVTKEGTASRYEVDAILRYSPPAQKHFGPPANDPNSYWIRPFLDPEVAWTGTKNGAWDQATQDQYPEFDGWIAESEKRLNDDDPTNDLSPQALQEAFRWQFRKEMEIVEPDYVVDVGVGGPVPLVSSRLGNARFYAAYREDQEMYLIPLSRDRYKDRSGHLKLTSDIGPGMKLSLEALLGQTTGTASSRSGQPGIFRSAFSIASQMDRVSFIDTRIFSTDYWAPTTVRRNMQGAKFTHALDANTYYEVRLTRFESRYDTNPGRPRDNTPVVFFGGVGFDEAPFGFEDEPTNAVTGMRTGVGMSNARDTSRVTVWNLKGDFTRQVNRFLQVKTGLEYNLTDSKVRYGQFDAFLPSSNLVSQWDRQPTRGAAYAQGKLEFQGMIANLGLRLDYFRAGGTWYDIEDNPFSPGFRSPAALDTLLGGEPTRAVVSLSPRLGVSFPVTSFSKLFVNYGHFRAIPNPNDLFLVEYFPQTGQLSQLADPNNPLPKTIAYELGYEHALFDQFLVRAAGYYKDVSLQPRLVNYISRDGQVDYFVSEPLSYEDIRGFELTLARNRGRWIQGFVNYTYMVFTSGYFGFRQVNENPTVQRQFEESDAERRAASSRPVPQPYGRLNIDVLVPPRIGPEFAGVHPLANWRLSFIGRWQKGSAFTWTGGGSIPGIVNNVRFRDSYALDLRVTRDFDLGNARLQFFMDVNNLLNRKEMSFSGMVDGNDYLAYMRSLHLPASDAYGNIPGNDKPGDYRDYDVPFVPIDPVTTRSQVGSPDPTRIYYERDSGQYLEYVGGAWQQVPSDRMEQILEDKAYIDMPNMSYFTFLNPRDVYFGLRLNF